jgi:hypothetical protein
MILHSYMSKPILKLHEHEPSPVTEVWFASRESERKPSLNLLNPDDRLRDEGREDESESRTRLSTDAEEPATFSDRCLTDN